MNNEVPEIVVQYSADNVTWRSFYKEGDSYIRVSADGGSTYLIYMYYAGEDEPEIIEQYSADALIWRTNFFDNAYFVRFSVDGGYNWSGGVRFKDIHVKEQYGENVVIQYSENGSSWSEDYSKDVKYIRFWLDNGDFCTQKVSYNGTGTEQLAVVFSATGIGGSTNFNSYNHYFVRFSTDGGVNWSGVIRIRDYEHRYQYSASKTGTFHDGYIEGDIYTRYTEDNGKTWSKPYIFARDKKPFGYRVPLSEDKKAYKIYNKNDFALVGNFGLLQSTKITKTECKKFDSKENFTIDTYTFYCESVSWDFLSWLEEVKSEKEIVHKRDESGDGSAENPWKNLCYALEQIECLFQATCGKNYKIVVTGTVDYPVGTCKTFGHRGVSYGFFGFSSRFAGHPIVLDMTGATINHNGTAYLGLTGYNIFTGTFIVIGAKIKVFGTHLACVGDGSVFNNCSVEIERASDSLFRPDYYVFKDCECVVCDVDIKMDHNKVQYPMLSCFVNCMCSSCNAVITPVKPAEDYPENFDTYSYGFAGGGCKNCKSDGFWSGFEDCTVLLEESIAERCVIGFRGSGKHYNNCTAINCEKSYLGSNKSFYNNCKAIINNSYKESFICKNRKILFGDLFGGLGVAGSSSVSYECQFTNCSVEVNFAYDRVYRSYAPDTTNAFYSRESLLSNCKVNVCYDFSQLPYYWDYKTFYIIGYGGADNIILSCSFIGKVIGVEKIYKVYIMPTYYKDNIIENLTYECSPSCTESI